MTKKRLTIGQALAVIDAKLNRGASFETLTDGAENISEIENLLKLFHNNSGQDVTVQPPQNICLSESPYIQGNTKLLMACFISNDENSLSEREKKKLTKHLNDCYWCFRVFSQVSRDFHWTQEKIASQTGGSK